MPTRLLLIGFSIVALLTGCADDTYTLYRNNNYVDMPRIHVATFDTSEGEKYNEGNCRNVQNLLNEQLKEADSHNRFMLEEGVPRIFGARKEILKSNNLNQYA